MSRPIIVTDVDLVYGIGLSPVQQKLHDGLQRAAKYRENGRCRKQMRLALHGRGRCKLDPAAPLVAPENLEVAALFDSLYQPRQGRPYMDTNLVLLGLRLSESGQVVADNRNYHGMLLPKAVGGYQPGKLVDVQPTTFGLLSARPGVVRLRRIGNFLDICVGELRNGQPAVLYRIELSAVVGRHPRVTVISEDLLINGQLTMAHGEIREFPIGDGKLFEVSQGERVAFVNETTTLVQCDTKANGQPQYVQPVLPHMSTSHPATHLAAELNVDLLEAPLWQRDLPPLQVWLGFEREQVLNLVTDPEFQALSPELLEDLAKALSDDGLPWLNRVVKLQSTARFAGVIESLSIHGNCTRVHYQGGQTQVLPPTAVCLVKPGATVLRGQALGPICQGLSQQSWTELEPLLGDAVQEVFTEFLLAVSEPGVSPVPSYLLPQRYVRGVEHLALAPMGRPIWYLDVSQAIDFLRPELNAIVLPPMLREDSPVAWGDVEVFYQPAAKKKTSSRKARRNRARSRRDGEPVLDNATQEVETVSVPPEAPVEESIAELEVWV